MIAHSKRTHVTTAPAHKFGFHFFPQCCGHSFDVIKAYCFAWIVLQWVLNISWGVQRVKLEVVDWIVISNNFSFYFLYIHLFTLIAVLHTENLGSELCKAVSTMFKIDSIWSTQLFKLKFFTNRAFQSWDWRLNFQGCNLFQSQTRTARQFRMQFLRWHSKIWW